jgi:hypothetical protein
MILTTAYKMKTKENNTPANFPKDEEFFRIGKTADQMTGATSGTIGARSRTKEEDYRTIGEDYRISREDYRTIGEDYRIIREDYRTIGKDYRTIGEDYRTIGEDYRTIGAIACATCTSFFAGFIIPAMSCNSNYMMLKLKNISNIIYINNLKNHYYA